MHLPRFIIAFLFSTLPLVASNTEKAIFLGPEPVNVPKQSPSLADLHIDVLTPEKFSLRTHVDAIFPTEKLPRGVESWLILDDLTEGQRYELRVCWMATQPTAFQLTAYPLDEVFDSPELISSLYDYSTSRQSSSPPSSPHWETKPAEREASILFLRLSAAAEYFTTNRTLMQHPEPVLVDLILDPFLFNALPRSLVPTVAYIVLVAGIAWVVATRAVVPSLMGLVPADADTDEKKTQ